MKETHPAGVRSLLLSALILGSSAFQAQAYYHPEEGRWLSRDPIDEHSRTVSESRPQRSRDRILLYSFVENSPPNKIDIHGLFSKIINCCPCHKATLEQDEVRAQTHIGNLESIINGWISLIETSPGSGVPSPGYPTYILDDLDSALKVLDKASKKLKNGRAECSKKDSPIASAWPWGNTVTVYKPYWSFTERARGAHLLHEGTHMGSGTTDAAYFWQNRRSPYNTFFFNFSQIASTYDTWVAYGFCLPGYNCPTALHPPHSFSSPPDWFGKSPVCSHEPIAIK